MADTRLDEKALSTVDASNEAPLGSSGRTFDNAVKVNEKGSGSDTEDGSTGQKSEEEKEAKGSLKDYWVRLFLSRMLCDFTDTRHREYSPSRSNSMSSSMRSRSHVSSEVELRYH